ncbi:hypothetical protein DB88DRAFT_513800 [Papiliotrema laurentii]|uniref:JmjC domain-containing protein n=1 Tax=Papiliotrema laurentii TaxID=5418 RepID=A0AAD9CT72_PAPLA|nr:hypothetical protein DB88DRAFT_513800 [Papiliotrema laurentii]
MLTRDSPDRVPPRPFPTYDELSYEDCLTNHLLPNTPFLLSSKTTATWPCTAWRLPHTEAGPSRPNLDALRKYGRHVVPVANTLQREFSEFERDEQALSEVLDLWAGGKGEGLYVKDWHIFEEIEKEGGAAVSVYTVPKCLRDDWLNPPFDEGARSHAHSPETIDNTLGDFRFCYLGPRGTFTPLHRDVYGSYSWSANVVGRKLWWFFPPDQLERVKDSRGELVFDVREMEEEGGGIKVVQEEGEVIFVPSGWHHQVVNLDFCISINHNFFSSPTLPRVFDAMVAAQHRVEESIADILPMIKQRLGEGGPWREEWVEEVQALLERDAGWGWRGFWKTVRRNVKNPPGGIYSPPTSMRNEVVASVIARYKQLQEWDILHDAREDVLQVERCVA